MNNAGTPGSNKSSTRSWLIAGIVLLFVMAITSSIDASMFYIFLGATTFCFFMALRGWIGTQPWKKNQSGYHQQEKPGGFSFDFQFNQGSQQRQQHSEPAQQPFNPNNQQKAVKYVLITFAGVVAFFFLIIIIGVLFGNDDESEVQFYRDRAEVYLDGQQYDSARLYYRRVITRRPDDVAARIGYGKSFYFQEQYDSAIVFFNAANELAPDDTDAKLFRGRSYFYQKRYPEAMSEAEQLLVDAPDYNEALLLAGDILYTQEKFEEALTKYYQPAYDAGAASLNLCWIMAYIYDEKKKDLEKAIPLYKEALTYDNTVVDIYTRLSQITQEPEAGEYRKRVAELQQKAN
jgi:tetratricopeptide (TPR) repeat protein